MIVTAPMLSHEKRNETKPMNCGSTDGADNHEEDVRDTSYTSSRAAFLLFFFSKTLLTALELETQD